MNTEDAEMKIPEAPWPVPEVTPWFPGSVKPVRPGVYEREIVPGGQWLGFSQWDGKVWYWFGITPDRAESMGAISDHQSLPWRGLAQDPKARTA